MDYQSSESWTKILEVFPEMDFTKELEEKPELAKYLRGSINQFAVGLDDPLTLKEAPKLDEDFSKYILINGLPKCDEKKAAKLMALLVKLFNKRNFTIDESNITLNFDADKNTTGQAFIRLDTEEKAKISAALFNGHPLDKKHTFSACTFSDFEKIMAFDAEAAEENQGSSKKETSYLELNSYILESKKTPYAYQQKKDVFLKGLMGQTKYLFALDEADKPECPAPFSSDRPFSWSPRGTYLICIKSDKVEFVGGPDMKPILTINQPKVEAVKFSPCERYLMVYQPKNDLPYSIWNFHNHEVIREFEQERGEDAETFMWSFDGNYIAKKSIKTVTQEGEDGEVEVEKQFIAVYELPSMRLCEDSDGNRTSIIANGLQEVEWAPNSNHLVYTIMPEESDNAFPKVVFQEIPSRIKCHEHTFKDSKELRMYFHPQGSYLAVMNQFTIKKQTQYSVEVFQTQDMRKSVPHQQVLIKREVETFHGCIWEPNQGKLGVHTLSKKVIEAGQRQFSNDPTRTGVDFYQLKNDSMLGFTVKEVGPLPSEKVKEVHFSSVGNLFCAIESEGPAKNSLSFYMIQKISNEGQTTSSSYKPSLRGKRLDKELHTEKYLAAVEDTYEFKKLAKHEIKDKRWYTKWDKEGRFFVIQGRRTLLDKQPKQIKIYNMFGELVEHHLNLLDLEQLHFRPRPSDILKTDKVKKLKKDYKKMYEKIFKDEEAAEKQVQSDIVREQRLKVQNDFLDNFFLPMRQKYEDEMEKYQELFPIKEMSTEQFENESIFQINTK